MPRFRNENGIDIQLTEAEETARDAEEATWSAGVPARAAEEVQNNRRAAYQSESDHLHFEEARGEVPEGTWAAKVTEIKVRYPKWQTPSE
jgi:hypothetical protein